MIAETGVFRLERLNVTFDTPEGTVQAVRNLSLSVAPGECLGVVGESGAGKSQSFLAALGLLPGNGRASGRALLGEIDLLSLRSAELDRIRGAQVSMVFQDPMSSLTPHVRIGEQIAEPLIHHRALPRKAARERALDLLRQVHVTDPERRLLQFPHELSGGMRQRVMLAIALSCEPALLIADEPTTALDVTVQAQILALLLELKRSRRTAMILITHDMGAVAGLADRVAVMQRGELVETGSVAEIFKHPQQPYTRELLAAVPRIEVSNSGRVLERAERAPPALTLQDVRVDFEVRGGWLSKASLRAVDGVSFEVAQGEALGLVGESGSGKSTLARAALRLLPANAGAVTWLGRPVESLSQRELKPLRRDVQVIFQDPLASLDPRMTVGRIIAEPLEVHRPELTGAERQAAVQEALRQVRLDPALAARYPHELSGGQCQRVGIARAMILRPRVLVCDEAVSALDVTVQGDIVALLGDLKRRSGLTLLFISHNLAVVQKLCDRILVLYLGRTMELAESDALYSRPLHPYTRQLLESAPIPDPDIPPLRMSRPPLGEPPSPLSPRVGCVFASRCPHAMDMCHRQVPNWEPSAGALRWIACHRWRELTPSAADVRRDP